MCGGLGVLWTLFFALLGKAVLERNVGGKELRIPSVAVVFLGLPVTRSNSRLFYGY